MAIESQRVLPISPAMPKGAVKRALKSGSWTFVPLVILGYALLYDNSTSVPSALGANWTQLLSLPREVRLVEAVTVILSVFLLLDRRLSRLSRGLLLSIAVFIAFGVLSQMTHPIVSLVDAFRLMYAYVLPIMLFIIGREARLNSKSRTMLVRLLIVWVVLSALAAWYEFAWLRYPLGDDITGLNKDAHANGNLIFFLALLLTARAIFLHKRRLFVPIILLVITAVISSVLKSEIFSLLAVLLIVWVHISRRNEILGGKIKKTFRNRVIPIVAALAMIYVMGLAFSDLDTFNNNRAGDVLAKIISEPINFGPIASHLIAFNTVRDSPQTVLLGNGPYSYANPVSVGQGLESGQLGRFAQASLLLQYGESTESARVTLTSSVLAEFGIPAFLVLLTAYFVIGWAVWRERKASSDEQVAYATGVFSCWLILILTAFVTLAGSIDTISVAAPVMFLAGMTCRIGADESTEANSAVTAK